MTEAMTTGTFAEPASQLGRRLIFVGGCPRSGTTLVQNLLDSHPAICGGPEFLHLPAIVEQRNAVRESAEAGDIDEFCDPQRVDLRFAEMIERLLLPLADEHGCEYLSEKTPQNVLAFESLLELFPAARLIVVVRDPRGVVNSMLQVGRRAQAKDRAVGPVYRSVGAAARFVRNGLAAGAAAARREPARVLTVRYEDVVAEPEAQTRRLCEFLKLDWAEQMLTPEQQDHANEAAITNGVWYDKKMFRRAPDASNADKWKSQLSALQIARLNAAFADDPILAELGYDFSRPRPPALSRGLGAAVQRLADSNNLLAKNAVHLWRRLRRR